MSIFKKFFLIFGVLSSLIPLSYLFARDNVLVHSYKNELQLNEDYTYVNAFVIDQTVLTKKILPHFQTWSFSFCPSSQKFEVIEAYVIHPNGEKIKVESENIFIRPTPDTEKHPFFSLYQQLSITFPQLRVGTRIYISAKLTQIKPDVHGFSFVFSPPYRTGVQNYIIDITIPKSLNLLWKLRGDFKVEDKTEGNVRHIHAYLENLPSYRKESAMPSFLDFAPVFMVSSFSSWEDIGRELFNAYNNKSPIPSSLKTLAQGIVQNKKGKEAIDMLCAWMMNTFALVKVPLMNEGFFEHHTLEDILKNQRADSKDSAFLLQALLKTQGIESYPCAVGSLYNPLPLPTLLQFEKIFLYIPKYKMFLNPENLFTMVDNAAQNWAGRFAVIGTPHGKAIHLPLLKAEKNTYENKNSIEILPDGTIQGKSILKATGAYNAQIREGFYQASLTGAAFYFLEATREGGKGEFILPQNPLDFSPLFSVNGQWVSPKALAIDKVVCFWAPLGLNIITPQSLNADLTSRKRLYPFRTLPSQLRWVYEIKIPEGYKILSLPKNVSLENSGGFYKSIYKKEKDKIFITQEYKIERANFTPEEYEKLLRPLLNILEAETSAIFALERE
ncbi:MAG: DUF3857 domain-containing protein [Proteobacteria bacterium]|nr:DUF3857 domain-containing protein [Pseudomonadota bacterium]